LGESYFGLGSLLGYRLNDYSSYNKNGDSENKSSHSENTIMIGITTLIGVRSYLTKSLSVFVETQLNGYKTFLDEDHESKENGNYEYYRTIEGDGWGVDFTYIRLGLRFTI